MVKTHRQVSAAVGRHDQVAPVTPVAPFIRWLRLFYIHLSPSPGVRQLQDSAQQQLESLRQVHPGQLQGEWPGARVSTGSDRIQVVPHWSLPDRLNHIQASVHGSSQCNLGIIGNGQWAYEQLVRDMFLKPATRCSFSQCLTV